MSGTRKAILKFELESFYKSFDFSILDDLLVGNPEGADEEKLDWIKEKLTTSMKSPSYLIRNTLYN